MTSPYRSLVLTSKSVGLLIYISFYKGLFAGGCLEILAG